MEEITQKNNMCIKVGLFLLIIMAITLCGISTTFAKYSTNSLFGDDARVAKWGFSFDQSYELDLFDSSYVKTDDPSKTVLVKSTDGKNVLAPGMQKIHEVTLATVTGNAPETMYNYIATLSVDPAQDEVINKLDNIPDFNWLIKKPGDMYGHYYKTFGELQREFNAMSETNIEANKLPKGYKPNDTAKVELGYKWDMGEASDAETALSKLSLEGKLSSFNVGIHLRADQVAENWHTVSFDVKGVGTTPESQTILDGHKAKDPSWDGPDNYKFLGWFVDEAGEYGPRYDFGTPVTNDIKLDASWEKLKEFEVNIDTEEEVIGEEGSFKRLLTVSLDQSIDISVDCESEDSTICTAKIEPLPKLYSNNNYSHVLSSSNEYSDINETYTYQYNIYITAHKAGHCNLNVIVNTPKEHGYMKVVKKIPVYVEPEPVHRDINVNLDTSSMVALSSQTATVSFRGEASSIEWIAEGADASTVTLTPSADKRSCKIEAHKYCDKRITIKVEVKGKGYKDGVGTAEIVNIKRSGNTINMLSSLEFIYGDTSKALQAKATNDIDKLIWSIDDESIANIDPSHGSTTIVTPLKNGNAEITAYIPQTDVYEAAIAKCQVVIAQKDLIVVWGPESWDYDGSTYQAQCSLIGIVEGDDVLPDLSGTAVTHVSDASQEWTINGLVGSDASKYKLVDSYTKTQTIWINPLVIEPSWGDPYLTYTGFPQTPDVDIDNIVEGDTCNLTVENAQTNVGKYWDDASAAYISAVDNNDYTIEGASHLRQGFEIVPAAIDVPTAIDGLVYNGQDQIGIETHGDEDKYELTDTVGNDASTYYASAHITDDNFVWSTTGKKDDIKIAFVIAPKSIDAISITSVATQDNPLYDASEHIMPVAVSDASTGKTLEENVDYIIVSGNKQSQVGSEDYHIVVQGINNYANTNDKATWNIIARSLAADYVDSSVRNYVYNEEEHFPEISLIDKELKGGVVLTSNEAWIDASHSELKGTDHKDEGYTVHYIGVGNYKDEIDVKWYIDKAQIEINITGNTATYAWDPDQSHDASGYVATTTDPDQQYLLTKEYINPQPDDPQCRVSSSAKGKTEMDLQSISWEYVDFNVDATFGSITNGYVFNNWTQVELSISTATAQAAINDEISYTITVNNAGSNDASGLIITDIDASDTYSYKIDSLPAGATHVCSVPVTHKVVANDFVNGKTAFVNKATVNFTDSAGDEGEVDSNAISTPLILTTLDSAVEPQMSTTQLNTFAYVGVEQYACKDHRPYYTVWGDNKAKDVWVPAAGGKQNYEMKATLEPGYKWSDGTIADKTYHWNITPVNCTITANAQTLTYGDAPVNGTCTIAGLVGDDIAKGEGTFTDAITYTNTYTQYGAAGGSYTITPKGVTSINYNISFVGAKVTVNPKPVDISWDGATTSWVFDNSKHNPTPTIGGLVHGDTCTATVSQGGPNAGNYTSTITMLSNANYTLSGATGSLTCAFSITKATREVTLGSLSNTLIVSVNGNPVTATMKATPSTSTGATDSFEFSSSKTTIATIDSVSGGTATIKPVAGGSSTIKVILKDTKGNYEDAEITKSASVNNFTYNTASSENANTATVLQYVPASNKTSGSLAMPKTIKVSGTTYTVNAVGAGTDSNYFFSKKTSPAITFEDSNIKTINNYAFKNATSLTAVTFSSTITGTLGNSAFAGSKITSADMTNTSITKIGTSCFSGCSSLASVVIPSTLSNNPGASAFKDCTSLTASGFTVNSTNIVGVPDTVFAGSKMITSPASTVIFDTNNRWLIGTSSSFNSTVYNIPTTVTCIVNYAFKNRTTLKKVVASHSGFFVGSKIFDGCTALENFVIRKSGSNDTSKWGSNAPNTSTTGTKGAPFIIAGGTNTRNKISTSYNYTELKGAQREYNPEDMSYVYLTGNLTYTADGREGWWKSYIIHADNMVENTTRKSVIDLAGKTIDRGLTNSQAEKQAGCISVGDWNDSGTASDETTWTKKKSAKVELRIDDTSKIATSTTNYGGKITGGNSVNGAVGAENDNNGSSGAIWIESQATCQFVNGAITGNKGHEGGAVATCGKTDDRFERGVTAIFEMYGGVIFSNSCDRNQAYNGGGAVDIKTRGMMKMHGGIITSNSCSGRAGGVWVLQNSNTYRAGFQMDGGEISGNTCGSTYANGKDVTMYGLGSSGPDWFLKAGHVGYIAKTGTVTGSPTAGTYDKWGNL